MTTELTKTFFDTFGIEPRLVIRQEDWEKCKDIPRAEELFKCYPQITDRHYLELICVLGYFEIVYKPDNCEELKKYILKYYLSLNDSDIRELKHQVQAIFEGER